MTSLAVDIENTMRRLDANKASRLERLLRDALSLVNVDEPSAEINTTSSHQAWLQRLNKLRNSIGTGTKTTSTEDILDDLRGDRA